MDAAVFRNVDQACRPPVAALVDRCVVLRCDAMLARPFAFASAFVLATVAAASCANSGAIQQHQTTSSSGTGGGGTGGHGTGGVGQTACIQNNCNDDAECGACPNGHTSCDAASHRCVACGVGGKTCPAGTTCSSFGDCVPAGKTCPTDAQGTPTITCATSADCVACDPMHQVCDAATGKCVACTDVDSSACQSTDQCVGDACKPNCPATCATDNDCSNCGAPGNLAHACNVGKCAQCSKTYACAAGKICSATGICVAKCGQDGAGSCSADTDCAQCGGGNTQCHAPINGPGKCGPQAAGCSDLGQGVVVLPSPWDQITNTCSHDVDCSGVGIQLDVGKLLRDLTGISQIKDANLDYPMKVCAAVSVGTGDQTLSCGICVPCSMDTDCDPINVDAIAGQAFGPIGSVAAAVLLDEVFGPNDHMVHMYCQQVAGGYGVCAPCPGIVYSCGGN